MLAKPKYSLADGVLEQPNRVASPLQRVETINDFTFASTELPDTEAENAVVEDQPTSAWALVAKKSSGTQPQEQRLSGQSKGFPLSPEDAEKPSLDEGNISLEHQLCHCEPAKVGGKVARRDEIRPCARAVADCGFKW
eukprot:CAMPEP_0184534208 /NCGR_PEP_ID=MMETSP0198_2-20121128/15200_1 /TAXON_ID=1112570 /ORGANISM="Thraustochytrium sp., Strain LLF1b" /LENGTH=137 /DNA_ID=CAMNT_0026927101 /DNA_START=199 /DNA_END=609 /DNA_ORIENTATION=+